MTVSNTAVLGVRPTPHLIAGQSSAEDQRAVSEWVSLNTDAFVAYWEGRDRHGSAGPGFKAAPLGSARQRLRAVTAVGSRGFDVIARSKATKQSRSGERSVARDCFRNKKLRHSAAS